jgi:hypothetical protein
MGEECLTVALKMSKDGSGCGCRDEYYRYSIHKV